MNYFQMVGYPLLAVAALEIILGVILLRQNPSNSPINKSVAAFSLFSAGYSLCSALIFIRTAQSASVDLIARANWIGWFSIPAALQFLYLMRDEHSRTARLIGYILYPFWTVIYLLCLFTDLVEPTGYSLQPPVDMTGPLENPARFIGGLLILWVMYEVIVLRKRLEGVRRIQLNHFFHGTLFFGGGAALLAGFIQVFGGLGLGRNELGAYFSFPWVVLTFYAIMRYSLFDIRIILSRTVGFILIWFGFSLFHLWLTWLLEPLLGHNLSLLISISLIGMLFFGTPLSRLVQTWVQRIIVKGRYDYQHILKESINAVITILDRDKLLSYIIESTRRSMGVDAVYLFWRDEDGHYTGQSSFGHTPDSGKELILESVPVQRLLRERRPLTRKELERTASDERGRQLAEYLRSMDVNILIPMFYKAELQGVLALGERRSRELYLQSDIDLLETLAGHAAVAMENARLYEEAKRVKESLHESEEKFRALAQTLPAALFIHRGGKFLYTNPAAVLVTGYSLEELLNMDFWSVTHPDYRELIMKRGQGRLEGDQPPQQYEFKILKKNGEERWVLMTAGGVEYGGLPAVIGTAFDITERKRAEEERGRLYEENVRQYQQRIEEEERHLREKEKILRDLHDGIGGITTNIRLLSEMAKEKVGLRDIKNILSTISSLAREGLADIRGFLHSLDAKDMSWQSFAAELRNQGSSIIESHGMQFLIHSTLNSVYNPPGSLFCLNLFKIYKEALVNIVKHAKAKSVNVSLDITVDKLELVVADDGIGMASRANTGRGMSNMKSRTAELGGSLSITSGVGTTIKASFPLPEKYPGRGME